MFPFITCISIIGVVFIIGFPILIYRKYKAFPVLKFIGELFLLILLPILGFIVSNEPCQEHPFELNSYPTAVSLYILPLICYFTSSYFKESLPPLILALLPIGLMTGLIYCLALQIHFGNQLIVIMFPIVGFTIIAPLVGFIYLFIEFISLHKYQHTLIAQQRFATPLLNNLSQLFLLPIWQKTPIAFFLCAPLLALLQFILTLFGQMPDSMITMFTESCGFLLSYHHDCSCGGDHYLCSVAANGNKTLVKPVRMGLRKNEIIMVNRQLLIANAFENWMEEHIPNTHRLIRKTYDSMRIPVNKWAKQKRKANLIYLLMKPLEWFFLVWLYCFDKKPESRIALQYLPKHDFESFKKQNVCNPTNN